MNFKRIKSYSLGLALLCSTANYAQTVSSNGAWHTVVLKHNLNDKFVIKNELHVRRTQFYKDWQQFLIRPAIEYKLNNRVSLSSGYTFITNYTNFDNSLEHNIWEEVVLYNPVKQLKISHRFRFEQRFAQAFFDESFKHSNRLRYRLTLKHNLFKTKNDNAISATVFNELWLHTGNGIQPTSINQNWVYVGLDFPIQTKTKFSVGYLNTSSPAPDNIVYKNNIIQLSLSATI